MSRFFNQGQKTQKLYKSRTGNGVDSLGIEALLSASRHNDVEIEEAHTAPISSARSLHLSPQLPVLAEDRGTPQQAEEAYRALRTRLLRLQATEKLVSIAVTSPEPGEGKTVTSINLAICYARLFKKRVLLVDGDLRTKGLSLLMSCERMPGVAEVLQGSVPFDEAVASTNFDNLYVIGAGECTLPASELFAKAKWKEFMEWCSSNFSLVLVDSPPVLGLADFELIAANCGGVLLVVRARITERTALQETTRQLDKKKLLGIVLNGQNGRQNRAYNYYYNKPLG
jgi:capsular exopolysaccharide synthesis family protein